MKRARAGAGGTDATALEERVRLFVREHRMLAGVRTLLVAVSGGPDSMVLLHLLAALAPSLRLRLRAAHLHHGLRGRDADRDLALVRSRCRLLGVPLDSSRLDVRALARRRGLSLEAAAREARYAFLSRCASRAGAEAVALGHTAGDQAETFLMRLLRGAGGRGLGGIRPVRAEGALRVVRPILCLRRAEVLACAAARGVPHREDASNRDRAFTRNRVRHGLIPYLERNFNPGVREALLRTAEVLAREHGFCDLHAARRYRALARGGAGRVFIPARRFLALHPALRAGVLRRALAALGAEAEVRFADAEAVARLSRGAAGGRAVCLPRGVEARREYADLAFGPGPTGAAGRYEFPLRDRAEIAVAPHRLRFRVAVVPRGAVRRLRRKPAGLAAVWGSGAGVWPLVERFSLDALGDAPLTVRNRRPGDRYRPFGSGGERKLKEIMIDEKLPVRLRALVPLVARGGEVVWLPGHRIAEAFRVTPATRRVLELALEKAPEM